MDHAGEKTFELATGPYVEKACGTRQRLHGSWWDSQAAQAARPRPRARHPHSRAALAWHGPSRGGLRAVRLGEDAAVKLAIRRSLADVAEAAHQEDVAEAVALEEALTVSSREAALLEQRAQRAARDRRFDGGHHVARRGPLQVQWLRQPASLLRLLQRPVWLDAWLRGEEERASLLWRGLPNHVMTQAWTQGALASMYNDHDNDVCLCVFNVSLRAD